MIRFEEPWLPIDKSPRDGSTFTVLCKSFDDVEVVVENLGYAHAPMDRSCLILWGTKNVLSSYLEPIGWRPK